MEMILEMRVMCVHQILMKGMVDDHIITEMRVQKRVQQMHVGIQTQQMEI